MRIPTPTVLMLLVSGFTILSVAQNPALQLPPTAVAGKPLAISASGQGKGMFYLIGPAGVLKQAVDFGQDISISGEDLTISGMYQAVACGPDGCTNKTIQVQPSDPARLNFLLHPSRVPVSAHNAVNATVLVFDRYRNTVLAPTKVTFRISLAKQAVSERSILTTRGVAWFGMDSRPTQGALEVTATLGEASEPRVIQQVASEACHLRMTATSNGRTVNLQTDPIRDCAGNPLPDGTIVSFTKLDSAGKSTVDTPIKKEKATAQFTVSGRARISVACGVVVGNEVALGGGL